jgi:membrane fusion protein (multidrug efflux system)
MLSVPVVLVGGAVAYYVANLHYISTDNAYVRQDKVSISPLVTGTVIEVAVRENQQVKAGDLLFRIDPEPFRIAIAQADAAIAAAQVRVIGMQTELAATGADIEGAQQGVVFYQAEYERQSALMSRGFSTRARLQQAEHDLNDARTSWLTCNRRRARPRPRWPLPRWRPGKTRRCWRPKPRSAAPNWTLPTPRSARRSPAR